jgi:histidinol-phosphatase (PHP family)
MFPELIVLSGLEIGEPHWHADAAQTVLASGPFDRVIGSLHCLPVGESFQEPGDLFTHRDPAQVLSDYLLEVAQLVTHDDSFSVLGHIDYPVRSWPRALGRVPARATRHRSDRPGAGDQHGRPPAGHHRAVVA